MPEHTWWNGLWPPEHSHPGPSQVTGTDSQGGPALEMCGNDVFEGSFWLPGFESKTWATLPNMLLHLGSHAKPEELVTWDQTCAQGPNDQPHHGILLEQSPSVQLARPTEGGSPQLPWAWPICIGYPFWAANDCTPTYADWFGGSIVLDWPFPSVPSLSLAMTRLRTGSASWAWCQSSSVIQVTCLLSWMASKMCSSQL